MKIETRIVKNYRFRDHYAFVLLGDAEAALNFYIRSDESPEMLFIARYPDMDLDDTDTHLSVIEKLGDAAVLRYEELYPQTAPVKLQRPEAETPAPIQLSPMKSGFKKLGSVMPEEQGKVKSLAMTQKQSRLDFRTSRQGDLVRQDLEGNEAALLSDLYSVIELINRRISEDIRPILLGTFPSLQADDLEKQCTPVRGRETTIRYIVNDEGRMSACSVAGEKYPLCITLLTILSRIGENAPDGLDSFLERVRTKLEADLKKKPPYKA